MREPPGTEARFSPARHAAVFGFFLVLSILMTWPTAARLDDYFPSEFLDAHTAFYNLWWFHQAVALRVSPWLNPLINYPDGFSMSFFPVWIPYDTLAFPMLHAWGAEGMARAFNLINFFLFALAGYSAFLLVKRLTRDPGAAIVAGLALAFLPYRIWNLTRWHVSCLELIVLLIYFFLRAVEDGGRKAWIGLAASAALLAYTSPAYTSDLALALPLVLIMLPLAGKKGALSRNNLIKLSAAALAAGIVFSPFLVHVAREAAEAPMALAPPESLRTSFSANLLGFFSPGFNLKTYSLFAPAGSDPAAMISRTYGTGGYEVFLGFTVMAFAAFGLYKEKLRALPWLVPAVLFASLALGPSLHAGFWTGEFGMPYGLAYRVLPWLRFERTPVRHFGAALPFIVVLMGMGLAQAGAALKPSRRRLFYLAAGALVLIEFNQAPLTLDRFPVPGFVYGIKNDPAPGSVLDLPQVPETKRIGGYYQMFHHRPVIFALSSRGADTRYKQDVILKHFDPARAWFDADEAGKEKIAAELRAEFARRQIRYVILYPKFLEPQDLAAAREMVEKLQPEAVIVDDGVHVVFRFEPWK